MTPARGSATVAVTGAWFGLLIGLLVGLSTFGPAWLGLLFGGLLIGASWGALFGYLATAWEGGLARLRFGEHAGASRYEPTVVAVTRPRIAYPKSSGARDGPR